MAAHLLLLRRRRLLLSLRRLCRGRHAFRWGLCGRRLRRRGGRRRGCGRRRQLACELDGPGTGRLELPDDLGLGLDGHVVDRDHFAADGQPRGLPTNSRACSGGGQDGGEAQRQRRLASQRWRSYFCGAARNAVAGHDSFDRDAHAEAALPLRDADADGGHLGGFQRTLSSALLSCSAAESGTVQDSHQCRALPVYMSRRWPMAAGLPRWEADGRNHSRAAAPHPM